MDLSWEMLLVSWRGRYYSRPIVDTLPVSTLVMEVKCPYLWLVIFLSLHELYYVDIHPRPGDLIKVARKEIWRTEKGTSSNEASSVGLGVKVGFKIKGSVERRLLWTRNTQVVRGRSTHRGRPRRYKTVSGLGLVSTNQVHPRIRSDRTLQTKRRI